MGLAWKLLLINSLGVAILLWLIVDDSLIETSTVVGSLLLVALATWGQTWLIDRSHRPLENRLRALSMADLDDPLWQDAQPDLAQLELHRALADLVVNTHRRIGQIASEKDHFGQIIESINAAVLVTDRDGRVVLINDSLARMFAVASPLVGRPAAQIVRNAVVQDAIAESLDRCCGLEVEIALTGGIARHLDVQVMPICEQEVCIGVVTVFYDITRLRQLERMRRDFVANVSHELRTPLTAIKGYAETLADGALDDRESAARFIGIISNHADRLNRLLDDLLDLSLLESEQIQVESVACRLKSIADSCIKSLSRASAQKGITVYCEIAEHTEVVCDAKLIEQTLTNLLDNAIKYTPEAGEVHIGTRPAAKADRITIYVEDNGIGIPSEDLGQVFERFYRVDKGRSRAMGGTGLGLAIVRHSIEAHGEQVRVESRLGEGTTFSFDLRLNT